MSGYREAQPPGFTKTSELHTWESTHVCPRCGYELYCGKRDEIEIEACGHCGGVWLRDQHAQRALATNSRAHEELARKVELVTRARPWKETKAIVCPECRAPMARRMLGVVVVDMCVHGTWFDRTELGAVMRARRGESEIARGLETDYLREHAERRKWGPLVLAVELFRLLAGRDRGA